ncbi:MAG TPA: lactate racemase domain-containing protein, partial [Spirochaetota bacterium]|nr:lactate racemase domain-containing protein [Spirochaetota bacterium]
MQIKLPWGKTSLDLTVPDSWQIIYPQPRSAVKPDTKDELAIVSTSLKKPSGSTPLGRKNLKKKKAVIIVDDNTRPTPAYKFFH